MVMDTINTDSLKTMHLNLFIRRKLVLEEDSETYVDRNGNVYRRGRMAQTRIRNRVIADYYEE